MKISVRKVIYIFTIVIMCGFKFVSIPYMAKYALGLLWFFYSITRRSVGNSAIGKQIARLFLIPYIVIFFVSPLLMLAAPVQGIGFSSSIFRMVSLALQATSTILFAYASYRLFGTGAVGNAFTGLVINNLIGIAWAVYKFGLSQFLQFVRNPFADVWNTYVYGGRISNALELHEVTFALGLFIIFFAFYKDSPKYSVNKNHYMHLLIALVFVYLGFKRIQLLALVAMFVVTILINRRKQKRTFQIANNLVCIGTVIFMFAYLFIISTDYISELGIRYNINFMSRLGWFNALSQYYKVSPIYLGRGWGTVSKIVDKLGQGTHNDILRNYIEFGFWGFLAWMIYYLKLIPNKTMRIDQPSAKLYLYLIIYAMVTYMTDNTFNYMIFQSAMMMILMVAIHENRQNNCEAA